MTKELETIQRQFIDRAVTIPESSAFGSVRKGFDALSRLGTFAAEKISTEFAQQKGATDAFDNVGKPKKLAPGLTSATKAYNNAYNNVETSLATLTGTKLLDDDLRTLSEQGKLNSESVGLYDGFAKNRIQGTLDGTSEQNKADVAVRLTQHYFQNMGRMADRVSAFNTNEMNKNFAFIQDEGLKAIQESMMAGDIEGVKYGTNIIEGMISDRKALGVLSPGEENEIRKTMDDATITSKLSAGYLNAVRAGTENQYLSDLGKEKPAGLTFEQWQSGISSVLKLKSTQDRATSEQEAVDVAKWDQKILTNQVQTLKDLDGARSEVSALNFIQLENKFIRSQASELNTQAGIQDFIQLNAKNPSAAARVSDKYKNATYGMINDRLRDEKRLATGDKNAELTLVEKTQSAQYFNVPIQSFNDEMNYALLNGSPDKALEAVIAYKKMSGDRDDFADNSPAMDLDKQAEQIAVSAAIQSDYTTDILPEAIEKIRKNILNVNSEVKQARLDNYQANYVSGKHGDTNVKKAFRSTFGVNADDNPQEFNRFKTTFRLNAGEMGTLDEALEFTKRSMTPVISVSKFGESKNKLMLYAPEKVIPFIDNGNWFQNQELLALNKLVNNYAKQKELSRNVELNQAAVTRMNYEIKELFEVNAAGLSPEAKEKKIEDLELKVKTLNKDIQLGLANPAVSIEWDYKNKLPESMSEKDLLNKNLLQMVSGAASALTVGKATIKVGGKSREVFINSDSSTRNRDSGKITYGFYYKDDNGFQVSLPDVFNPLGVAEWAVDPFGTFLPATMTELDDNTMNQISQKEAAAIFDRDNANIRPIVSDVKGESLNQFKARRKADFVKENSKKIKEKLLSERKGKAE